VPLDCPAIQITYVWQNAGNFGFNISLLLSQVRLSYLLRIDQKQAGEATMACMRALHLKAIHQRVVVMPLVAEA
jgi:hypothetical protein